MESRLLAYSGGQDKKRKDEITPERMNLIIKFFVK